MFVDRLILDVLIRGLFLSALALFWIILLVRLNGLRSFSKMTNFDFVMTIAVGSLLAGAGQTTSWSAFLQTLVGMSALFIVQHAATRLRKSSNTVERIIQNQPVVLMRDGQILEEALAETRVAKSDLIAKLREANVLEFSMVRAVILETTGDISVLHGSECSEALLQGTTRVDQ
jgi:uncharacterized membrane protein YcaP (DUF421 family)